MPLKNRNFDRGFTLTEILVTVTILGLVITLGSTLFIQFENFYLSIVARQETQRDARTSINLITDFARQAQSSTVCIGSPTDAVSCLTMLAAKCASAGYFSTLSFITGAGRRVEFCQNGNQLLMAVDGDVSVLSRNLVYIAFSFPNSQDTTLLNVALSMGKNVQLGRRKVLEISAQKVRVMN